MVISVFKPLPKAVDRYINAVPEVIALKQAFADDGRIGYHRSSYAEARKVKAHRMLTGGQPGLARRMVAEGDHRMKALLIAVMIAAAAGLSGCTTISRWSDADGVELTPAQLARDKYACAQEAYNGGRSYGVAGSPLVVTAVRIDETNVQNMMFRMCMEARGYTLIN